MNQANRVLLSRRVTSHTSTRPVSCAASRGHSERSDPQWLPRAQPLGLASASAARPPPPVLQRRGPPSDGVAAAALREPHSQVGRARGFHELHRCPSPHAHNNLISRWVPSETQHLWSHPPRVSRSLSVGAVVAPKTAVRGGLCIRSGCESGYIVLNKASQPPALFRATLKQTEVCEERGLGLISSGFRVPGAGCRVQSSRVQGLGFKV